MISLSQARRNMPSAEIAKLEKMPTEFARTQIFRSSESENFYRLRGGKGHLLFIISLKAGAQAAFIHSCPFELPL